MNERRDAHALLGSVFTLCLLVACASDPGASAPNTGGNWGAAGARASGSAGASLAGQNSAGAGGMGVAGTGASGATSAAGGSASSAGAGSPGSTGSAIEPSFATVKLVFGGGGGIESCAAAPCHGAGGNAPPGAPVTLADNDQLYANLTTYVSMACGNRKLVTPGKPAESALLQILRGPCGLTPQMPYQCKPADGTCIPDEYVAAISQWILNGAPK